VSTSGFIAKPPTRWTEAQIGGSAAKKAVACVSSTSWNPGGTGVTFSA
jgi:hypothetical protein